MKTVKIKIFKFAELSKEAQQKVLNNNRHVGVEYDEWWMHVYETFKEEASDDFEVRRMYFSGFWSQGDGAMFEYGGIESTILNSFVESLNLSPMRKNWILNNVYASASGKHSGHYYHEKSVDHNIHFEVDNADIPYGSVFYRWIESFALDFEDFVVEKYEALCHKLYSALEKEYEYLISDENVKECISEQMFTKEGEIWF